VGKLDASPLTSLSFIFENSQNVEMNQSIFDATRIAPHPFDLLKISKPQNDSSVVTIQKRCPSSYAFHPVIRVVSEVGFNGNVVPLVSAYRMIVEREAITGLWR
jgi:hypothetical protein